MNSASVTIATLLSAKAGLEAAPLVAIAVVITYLESEALSSYIDARIGQNTRADSTRSRPGAFVGQWRPEFERGRSRDWRQPTVGGSGVAA